MDPHRYFHSLTAERRGEVLAELSQASSPGFDYFLLVVLSCSIASFGLIADSSAVIIGAMLVAPLMSPILGLSLASVAGEREMFQRAVLALAEGVALALTLSAIWGWLAQALPFDLLVQLPDEIQARTRPTPLDLGIALAGGMAAAYALAQPRLSAALPGVAIATALMPPVCTVGIGIALSDPAVAFGAALLFFTNFVAISFAGILVFAALGFRPKNGEQGWRRLPRSLITASILVLLTAIPLVVLSLRVVQQARFEQSVRRAVSVEINTLVDAQLVQTQLDASDSILQIRVTLRTSHQPTYEQVIELQRAIASRLQRVVELQLIIVPITRLDPLEPPTLTPTATAGPSSTPTLTATSTSTAKPTPTPSATPTPTATASHTPTPTATYTPTPILAYIAQTGGTGIFLRDAPGGKIIPGALPEGAAVHLLYRRETLSGQEWMEVRDLLGRVGWLKSQFLILRP